MNTIHDCCVFYIDPALNRGLLSSRVYLWVLKRAMRWTNRRADATVTVSHFSKRMLERHLGLPAARIRVCYHGLELPAPGSEATSPSGGDGSRPYFLFVGTNLPKKNIAGCIAAFARLPEAVRRSYTLRLKTGSFPENRRQIEELRLGSLVEFIDRNLDEAEMARLYNGASLVLLLSFDEGFGLPIIEAYAAGVPVLVSDRAACAELVPMPECRADPDDVADIAKKWLALVEDGNLRRRCLDLQATLLPQFDMRRASDAFFESLAC